jgi:N6-adenosine-specific RNA methylase IME4
MIDLLEGLPRNHFGAILADPPWRFETWSDDGKDRAPEKHYSTMRFNEIEALDVRGIAANDCVLFMWISWPLIEQALVVIDAWGFEYKTCAFSWMKANGTQIDLFNADVKADMKLGYWTRSNSEVCLLATRGKPKRLSAAVRQGIIEPAREHSRKPDCVHNRIEQLVAGPYLELFARQQRAGWTCVGNQVDKFKSTVVNIAHN